MSESLKEKASIGFIWSAGERFSTLISDFIISISLARLLSPSEFGLIAMVTIFVAILAPFVEAGLGMALIRKQDVSDEDYSTVFWWNIGLSIFVYIILYMIAPSVSKFYKEPLLINILRVVGLMIILNSFSMVQGARLIKHMDFRSLTIRTFICNIISGALGVYLAFKGWGYWALIVRQLSSTALSSVLIWIFSKWVPLFKFSLVSFKNLFGFGSKLLLSNLIEAVFLNIYPLLIGKLFSPLSLGYYNRAKAFTDIPQNFFSQVIAKVTLPVFAGFQSDDAKITQGYRRLVQILSFIYFPIICGLFALSKGVVLVLLGEKWSESIYILQGLAFVAYLYPLTVLNLNLLNIKGRSDLILFLEVIKKILTVVVIMITYKWGIIGIVYGQVFLSIFSYMVNVFFTKRLIGYEVTQQLNDIFPNLILSIIMGLGLLWSSERLGIYTWWSLMVWFIVSVFFYITLSFGFNKRDLFYTYKQIKKQVNRGAKIEI